MKKRRQIARTEADPRTVKGVSHHSEDSGTSKNYSSIADVTSAETAATRLNELTKRFMLSCGLPIPHPATPAGELHDGAGRIIWQWFKCKKHDTWMQPCFCKGFSHWHCGVMENGVRCNFVKAAKMRTWIEQRLFSLWKYLVENG